MSEYVSKKAVLEWLERQHKKARAECERDRASVYWHVMHEIQSGAFDTPEMESQSVAGQALSTTTEPTGARREICPDHPDEKPQVSSSHTWTQDGNTYFVSYVEYCPACYHVISTSARL